MRLVDRMIATGLPAVPRPVVRHFADRYMAGETLDDAIATVQRLNALGAAATIDVLGEFTRDLDQAAATAAEYERVLDAIASRGLDSTVSVKLSAVGLESDRSIAERHIESLAQRAAAHRIRMRIDMEHSGLTDDTLAVFRRVREEGHDNVGIVLQSYLRRTFADLRDLAPLRPAVRLVKGIYVEPPEIAYKEPDLINRNFVQLLHELVRIGSRVAVASHDEELVGEARRLADERGLSGDQLEFQLLLGVKEDLRDRLIAAGYRVRIYVPYGEAWYGYSMRRLKENPSIAGYVARDVIRGLAGLR